MQTFEKFIVVAQQDLDQLHHVNNVRYVQWIQDVAAEHWESKTTKTFRDQYYWVLIEHHIKYKNPAILGDVLKFVTYLKKWEGVRSIRIVEIYDKSTEKLLVKSETTWCLINSKTSRPARITDELAGLFI